MKFHLKIRDGATEQDRSQLEQAARDCGASIMRPLFPDAPEPSLNTLYSVDVSDGTAEKFVASVRSLAIVEFVEKQAKRTIRRG
ncbi:hypothetical protein [Dongia deserti]|uniref:hypothetical protein n=1 Tax=Dongia deserti TaxID=2268030 RepID=UPI000E65819A|nr:hypothetical protein [Dongia deserti]